MKNYIIATSARSGSHLIGAVLKNLGVGKPHEDTFWDRDDRPILDLKQIHDSGTLGDFWGGIIHWERFHQNVRMLRKLSGLQNCSDVELFNKLFPDVKFIHLTRLNALRQAISYKKASQSGQYLLPYGKHPIDFAFHYDEYDITHRMYIGVLDNSEWSDFFAKSHIKPFRLLYEDLADDLCGSVTKVLEFIGAETPPDLRDLLDAMKLPQKQSDDTTEVWVNRYLQKHDISDFNRGRNPLYVSEYLEKTDSDKVVGNNYADFYDMVFSSMYQWNGQQPLKVLEIGVSWFGEGSGHAFSRFPYIQQFVGIDPKEIKTPFDEKGVFIQGNAYSDACLKSVEKYAPFHILIDDGDHSHQSQVMFFEKYARFRDKLSIMICENVRKDEIPWRIASVKNVENIQHLASCPLEPFKKHVLFSLQRK